MGMTGSYFRTDEETVREIRNGTHDLSDFIYDESGKDDVLDVDKAWHAIQFTLNGAPQGGDYDNIFSRLVLSGNMLLDGGDEFSAMLISADDVKELAPALAELTWEDVRGRFSVEDMLDNDIYPVTEEEDEEEFFEYVWSYLSEMKAFFEKAAEADQVVVFSIS